MNLLENGTRMTRIGRIDTDFILSLVIRKNPCHLRSRSHALRGNAVKARCAASHDRRIRDAAHGNAKNGTRTTPIELISADLILFLSAVIRKNPCHPCSII